MKVFQKKCLFLALLFCMVVAATIWLDSRQPSVDTGDGVMGEATLPVVRMEYEGEKINLLHGYTTEMAAAYMHGTITPLPQDRNLIVHVTPYGNEIKGASYAIWSSDMERLVEDTEAQITEKGEFYRISCPLQNLLEQGQEYVMILKVETDRHQEVYYYTRLWYGEREHEAEMLAFARDFSEKTFDKEAAHALTPYLESDSTGSNESLGHVNIHSSFAQITWGDLAPVRLGEPELSITEMNDTYGSYVFRYQVSAQDGDGKTETYEVEERFTIRWSSVRCYLMAYDRVMNQKFETAGEFVAESYLDFGIQSGEGLQAETSPDGNFSFFTLDGELWSYNADGCQLTSVFSFQDGDDDGVRTDCKEHDIRIVHVDDQGNAEFLVYGYMNRGVHEGETGLAFYEYLQDSRELREVFYLPSDRPYQVIKREMGQFFYISEDDLLYWMYHNGIYAIDFMGSELIAVVDAVQEDQLALSWDNSAIAWQKGETPYDADEVQVLYLSDGTERTIEAPEGTRIRALGFLGEDFVYGLAREEDISDDPYTTVPCPMYALVILGKDGTEQGRYEYDGIYVSEAEVVDNRLNLQRVSKNVLGKFQEISDDTLLQNTGETAAEESPLYEAKDGNKKLVYRLAFPGDGKNKSISFHKTQSIRYDSSSVLQLDPEQTEEDPRYYAYAKGELAGIYHQLQDAVAAITAEMGTVTDGRGKIVWTRVSRPAEKEIDFTEMLTATNSEDALRACVQMLINAAGGTGKAADYLQQAEGPYEALRLALGSRAVNARGLTVSQLLSCYLAQGTPVLGILDSGVPVLIVGYDAFNVTLYDPVQNRAYKMGQETAAANFGVWGNWFVTYTP